MVNSRAKGSTGERELAEKIRTLLGVHARRTNQFCGNEGTSDVLSDDLPNLYIEVKRVQKLNITAVMEKAVEQCEKKIPVVCHRRDRKPWLLTVRLEDLAALARELSTSTPVVARESESKKGLTSSQPKPSSLWQRPCT